MVKERLPFQAGNDFIISVPLSKYNHAPKSDIKWHIHTKVQKGN
jgi:hypothetical protein